MNEIRLQIPRVLARYADGRTELWLAGATVGELLTHLRQERPELYRCVCDETGRVRTHINLFVNNDFLHQRDGLNTELTADDVVSVFQAVSGG
ncbi:MAG: MoaD/ThiS family protein [Planctomycetales bacterium]|nr:MoaD/ThiS family protein [Planctomycetales bacterium]